MIPSQEVLIRQILTKRIEVIDKYFISSRIALIKVLCDNGIEIKLNHLIIANDNEELFDTLLLFAKPDIVALYQSTH